MNREVHVRIWERPEVRILRATRRLRSILYRAEIGGSGWLAVLRLPAGSFFGGFRTPAPHPASTANESPASETLTVCGRSASLKCILSDGPSRADLYRPELTLTRQKGCVGAGSRVADVVVGVWGTTM